MHTFNTCFFPKTDMSWTSFVVPRYLLLTSPSRSSEISSLFGEDDVDTCAGGLSLSVYIETIWAAIENVAATFSSRQQGSCSVVSNRRDRRYVEPQCPPWRYLGARHSHGQKIEPRARQT